ncbi:hypothetical protein LTR28_013304 [Elasticomyces elasticus]|nr:hypothetical protein LTR28_013304 [Elasticomyces elasticus]
MDSRRSTTRLARQGGTGNRVRSLRGEAGTYTPSTIASPSTTTTSTVIPTTQAISSANPAATLRELRAIERNLETTWYTPAAARDGYEILLRRSRLRGQLGRELGVRTAGLAISRDGRTLWCGTEEGIFEVELNLKGRFFWPAVEPR